jgi:uncharacterized protein
MSPAAVASPCTSVCRMDPRTGWCEGCARTLDEIADWSVMSDDDKRAVWEALARRKEPSGAGPSARP